ncbi:hypothetical protein ACJRO0_05755 [Acetobacter oryzifermentans]|uniref:hypothetical protein n=1 Tax=Acetobacter oryzifermentans TaxID=1633874 RepID=UPI0039BF2E22
MNEPVCYGGRMKFSFVPTRRHLPCVVAGTALLVSAPVTAATARGHAADTSGPVSGQKWSVEACMAMVGDDPFGARDYALDWERHGNGGQEAKHCHALALLEAGDEESAAAELDELAHQPIEHAERAPSSFRAGLEEDAADAWLSAGQPEKALRSVDYGLAFEDDTRLHLLRARALLAQDQADVVVKELSALVAKKPDIGAEGYVLLASAERRVGQLDAAAMHVAHALEIEPENPAALLERGIVRERKGDATGAQADWQRVLDLAPDSHEADLARQDLAVMAADPDTP